MQSGPGCRLPSWAPQAVGYAISAGCLIWFLRGYPIGELMPAIRSLDWRWVTVAVVCDLGVYACHAWRWNVLLTPVVRVRFWRTVQSIYIGLFANEILPLRVGELIRCYLLAHWNDLRISLSFASAAVERLLDGLWIIVAFVITAAFVRGIPKDLTLLVQAMGLLLILGAALMMWIVSRKHQATATVSEGRWAATLRHVVEGLHLMGDVRTLGMTALLSALYLGLQIVSLYALMKAYELDLSFWVAGGVLTIVRLATVVPNAPGNLGLLNASCVLAMRLFDVERNDAKTFSIIYYAAVTLPLLAGGAIAVVLTGASIGELHARARRSAAIAPAAPLPEER